MHRLLIRRLFALLLLAGSLPAFAVNYVFPGNMPTGCTGSLGNYTCPGGSLAYNDTVTISGVTPATITVNGNLTTSNGRINQGGSASNLTIRVNGTLTAEYQAVINANVQATVVNGTGGEVAFGGSISTTTGSITIGYNNTVAGNITSTTGAISIGGISQIAGQISCSCALDLDYDARVAGTISAASLVSDGRVYLQGSSVTTTGNFDLGYGSTLSGSVTAGGTLHLRGNIQAAQCLRSTSSSAITLEWNDRANGGVCCGALGSCSTSCVSNGSGAAMPSLCSGSSPATPPARFNAFETATAAASITGVIKTKVSGTAFSVAIVAVNTAGTGVATTFTGNVKVEVLDASNNSGALSATTNCRSSWGVASGTSSTTLSFAAADAGRKNVSLTVAEAFPEARIRVSYPDTGTATVIGCSTDNFAIRPSGFGSFSVTDATSSTAGTTRSLTSTSSPLSIDLSGNFVHKAGRPFTVRATALGGSGGTTALYTGTPTPMLTACAVASSACGGTLGTLTYSPSNTNGVLTATTATYSEAGAFTLQLVDSAFAAVDASDGSTTAERTITSGTLTVGRFVPDRFDLTVITTPTFQTFGNSSCTSRGFTYYGQPFGYATLPRATVTARNASGATTVNYPNSKFNSLVPGTSYATTPSSLGLSNTGTMSGVTISSAANGVADVRVNSSSESLSLARSNTTPQSPLLAANYAIATTWTLTDATETTGGIATNESISGSLLFSDMGFDSGAEFRYGILKLGSAYGSELAALPVPIETQYWNGTTFATNAADNCTTLQTSSLSLANFRSSLAACETMPTASSVTVAQGRASMRLQAPGNGNKGSVDGTMQLGSSLAPAGAVRCAAIGTSTTAAVPANLPWLQTKAAGGSTYDQNPSARFTFGPNRSPLIQLREMY